MATAIGTAFRNTYRNAFSQPTRAKVRDLLVTYNRTSPSVFDYGSPEANKAAMDRYHGVNQNNTNTQPVPQNNAGNPDFDPTQNINVPSGGSGSGGSGGSTAPAFTPIQYGGKQYDNYHDYYQALLNTAMGQHSNAVKQAESAYKEGLITFDQRQQAINLSRQNTNTQLQDLSKNFENQMSVLGNEKQQNLSNISGYFSNISPLASQSGQATLEGRANENYTQDVNATTQQRDRSQQMINQNLSALDQEEGNLVRAKNNYATEYQNQLKSLDQGLQNTQDSYANEVNAYKAKVAAAKTGNAGAAKSVSFSPVDVAFSLKPMYQKALVAGLDQKGADSYLRGQLNQSKITDTKVQDQLLNYFYDLYKNSPDFANS